MFPKGLPNFVKGNVVKGFGRGSKELGCPTANLSDEVVQNLPPELDNGVYFGFAQLEEGEVYEMVLSIGWNPFYENKMKTMEVHLLHKFETDFYGKELKVVTLGFVRHQRSFGSLNELIEAINSDISLAREQLKKPEFEKYKNHTFFKE